MKPELIIDVDPPETLILELERECEELELDVIKTAYFTDDPLTANSVGMLDVDEDLVCISLSNALTDIKFMRRGALYVPSTFFNLLHALYHECFHAHQIQYSEELRKLAVVPSLLDEAANVYATERCLIWATKNSLPTLEEMKWCGEEIKNIFKTLYHKHGKQIDKEIEGIEVGAAGELNDIFKYGNFTEKAKEQLMKLIEEEGKGVKSKHYTFLTPTEFFGSLFLIKNTEATLNEEEEQHVTANESELG
jgi:hypothetical protein